jgi:hypothetical protein
MRPLVVREIVGLATSEHGPAAAPSFVSLPIVTEFSAR